MSLCLLLLATWYLMLGLGCGSSDVTLDSYLIYPARLSSFRNTVVVDGQLEAKNAHVLTTPRVWPQPEIAYLTPEGTHVDSGTLGTPVVD